MVGVNGCDTRIIWSGTLSQYNTDVDAVEEERRQWEEVAGPSEGKCFLIQCQCCNNMFWSDSGNAKFCSDTCRHMIAQSKAKESVEKHKYCKDKKALYAKLESRYDDQLLLEHEKDDKVFEKCYILNELHTCPHYYTGQHGLTCHFCQKGISYPSMTPLNDSNCCAHHPLAADGKIYIYDTVDKTRHRVRYAVIPEVGRVRVDKNTSNLYYLDNKLYIKKGEELTEWKLPKQ